MIRMRFLDPELRSRMGGIIDINARWDEVVHLALFQNLKGQVWGRNVRLEQERIPWDYAWKILRKLIVRCP